MQVVLNVTLAGLRKKHWIASRLHGSQRRELTSGSEDIIEKYDASLV